MIIIRRLGRTRDLRALTAALSTALPLSVGAAQSPQPLSQAVVAALVVAAQATPTPPSEATVPGTRP